MSLERVEALLDQLEATADPEVLLAVRELIAVLLDAHAVGLERVLSAATDSTVDPLPQLLKDPLVTDLLLLHGLHPVSRDERAADAVLRLRADLGPAGDGLALRRVDDDGIEVSLPGVTTEIAQVIVQRLEREVPDAGPVVILELPVRALLPVVSG